MLSQILSPLIINHSFVKTTIFAFSTLCLRDCTSTRRNTNYLSETFFLATAAIILVTRKYEQQLQSLMERKH